MDRIENNRQILQTITDRHARFVPANGIFGGNRLGVEKTRYEIKLLS